MPPLTAKISAIVTATSEAMLLRLRLPDGGSAWHKTKTELILKDPNGQPQVFPLKAYGLLMADDVLKRDHTYHIHGPLGVDPVDGAFIKHSSMTQSLVATVPPQHADLAGKAWICSTGKVLRVAFENVEDGEWHLTVQAEHEIFDPEERAALRFVITYRFGHFSPELSEMENIEVNTLMTFEGLVVSLDHESKQLVVQVCCFAAWVSQGLFLTLPVFNYAQVLSHGLVVVT
ncbi:uncharacterized protein MELLADRAFT_105951 [Melampsora larici-populina 98AG31]|uniref:Uncharacterized protein n=1 Tax=Melampsora larici-populina (strain 98AG31 / pathotype 3-4-7) TaxID=747676 RepID=F4RJW0_MELLP|nr:uncharacterized protein MELLADRAFT_105951 [Melampsora larici-populina 98AG31]EGG07382.1 hypothetical protein MELLADRAFT_105951 [Melampsora larici-populina 98AG31]